MLTRYIRYIYLAALPLLYSSCIFEDSPDCPVPGYVVQLSVKDINYDNIDKFPQIEAKNMDMPFQSFVGTVYYVLSDMAGKHIIESDVITVERACRTFPIYFAGISDGEYNLTVWGNLTKEYLPGALHPDNREYTDIYIGSRTLRFDSNYQMTEVPLERTKGLLLLLCSGFPDNLSVIKMSVSGTYQSVDADFNYAGSGTVEKTMPFQSLTTSFLAPATKGSSILKLSFYTDGAETSGPFLKTPDIGLAISRNKISSVAIDYDDETGMCEIWMFIHEQWTRIHSLYIK